MSTAREELYQLADENSDGDKANTQNLTKDDVVSAIHEYSTRYNRKLCLRINERTLSKLNKFSINKEIRSWKSMMNYQDSSKV